MLEVIEHDEDVLLERGTFCTEFCQGTPFCKTYRIVPHLASIGRAGICCLLKDQTLSEYLAIFHTYTHDNADEAPVEIIKVENYVANMLQPGCMIQTPEE